MVDEYDFVHLKALTTEKSDFAVRFFLHTTKQYFLSSSHLREQ
jgi:hypothetical protein